MATYINQNGLKVDERLHSFIEEDVLPGLGIKAQDYWNDFERLISDFAPVNAQLLEKRDAIQKQIDDWLVENKDKFNSDKYKEFLTDIGYLVPEGEDFEIATRNVDSEVRDQAGPQLVVPTSNARFALNATNARWGSLYDALYGTDAISEEDGAEKGKEYNSVRGQKVIEFCRDFLDQHFALAKGSHHNATKYSVSPSGLQVEFEDGASSVLAQPEKCVAYQGDSDSPTAILLKNNGLHIVIEVDADSFIGKTDKAGVKDLTVEAAVTTIQDFEDSVAAVDAEDKVNVYRNWLGLMKGGLTDTFLKDGHEMTRQLEADRKFTALNGSELVMHGRSLLFVRNVGHLMTSDAIIDAEGNEVPEGIMDAMVSVLIAMHDLNNTGKVSNSRTGSIYIVKPKMHGPEEVAFANDVFNRVEDALGLEYNSIKIGIMDEERRTTVNLKECIRQVKDRVVFINTGFLDRTGDEIHTSMLLGPMLRKEQIKQQPWIKAYEDWNVDTGLETGFSGKAQIGKGMWAMPDEMADMMKAKIVHPQAGANTAWVPSPNGATLHALHYHQVNVSDVQQQIKSRQKAALDDILTIPVDENVKQLSAEEVQAELDNNIQGILGYVVRWIDQGIGCSKVPDIDDVGLMEDRATLRISSQHVCNWVEHGICTKDQVMDTFRRMAKVVDEQNDGDRNYNAMTDNYIDSLAFKAATDLVFNGKIQPNGYTEPLLHEYRRKLKAAK